MNSCLVIIDPQKDFIHPRGNYSKTHSGISQIQAACLAIEQLLAAPPASHRAIVYAHYQFGQFNSRLPLCADRHGREIAIEYTGVINLFCKTEHSAFSSPGFEIFLQQHYIERLFLCGFLAEYCVRQTAIDALQRNYAVSLLADCIGTGDDVQHRKQEMLAELLASGASLDDSTNARFA